MLIAANHHYVRPTFDAPYPGIHGITPQQFESQLTTLGGIGVFVGAGEVRDAILGVRDLPGNAIIVTFDDGLREQYEHALPVLQRLGIPAVFYVNTAPIAGSRVSTVHKVHILRSQVAPEDFMPMLLRHAQDQGVALDLQAASSEASSHYKYDTPEAARLKYLLNFLLTPMETDRLMEACFNEVFPGREVQISKELYMDIHQIQELAGYGYIGSHSHEHVPLGLLPPQKVEEQLRLSLMYLESWIGYRPFTFSYPYGSREASTREVGEAASRLGISFAFTMERAANGDLAQPLHLARFDNNDLPGGKAARFQPHELFSMAPTAGWFAEGYQVQSPKSKVPSLRS